MRSCWRGSRSSRTASAARTAAWLARTPARMSMPPAETAVPAEAVWQPRMLRALKTGLRTAYDYLGTVLLVSLAWVGLAMLLAIGGAGLLARFYATPTVGATLL